MDLLSASDAPKSPPLRVTPGAAHHLAEAKSHTHWFWAHSPQPIEHPQALAALLATIVSTDKREAFRFDSTRHPGGRPENVSTNSYH
jgi:hypothetical protein